MSKTRTLNEINDTSALLTRIKANLFDIDKTPLRLAARRADLARPITIVEELEREAPIHSTLDFSPLAMQIRQLCITAVHIRKEGTNPPRMAALGQKPTLEQSARASAKCQQQKFGALALPDDVDIPPCGRLDQNPLAVDVGIDVRRRRDGIDRHCRR